MSTIGSVSSSYASSVMSHRPPRPDASKMADQLFSQLDTTSKGYLEKSDLQSAFSQVASTSASSSSSDASVDDVFKQLDSDGDGKVTKDELSSSLKKLADQLDSQFDQMRMGNQGSQGSQGAQGMPPPPPPGGQDDAGFSKDELQSQLSDIGSSDSTRSDLISKIVNNFDKADTDSDGKVSFTEAMAYDQKTSSSSTSGNDGTGSTDSASSEQAIMKRIVELMQAYRDSDTNQASLLGSLSVSA